MRINNLEYVDILDRWINGDDVRDGHDVHGGRDVRGVHDFQTLEDQY